MNHAKLINVNLLHAALRASVIESFGGALQGEVQSIPTDGPGMYPLGKRVVNPEAVLTVTISSKTPAGARVLRSLMAAILRETAKAAGGTQTDAVIGSQGA